MARSKRFEDKSNPDRCKGSKPFTFPLREDGEIEGCATILEHGYDKALVIAEYLNGEITAFIEEDSEETEDD